MRITKALEQGTTVTEPRDMRAYDLARVLSLDVALGALGGGCMAAAYLGQQMLWVWYLLLPAAVWVIYTLDHLLDARRLGDKASTVRHRFHVRHFKALAWVAGTLAAACLGMALAFMLVPGIMFGLAMGGMVALHLLLVRWVGSRISPWLVKELGVATVYAVGIWGLPLIRSGQWQTLAGILPMVQFLLLALVNLLEFSLFELETDAKDGHSSYVQALGRRRSIRVIRLLLALTIALGVALLLVSDDGAVLRIEAIYALMAGLLGVLLHWKAWFSIHERYRAWGDGAFLLPYLYLAFTWG